MSAQVAALVLAVIAPVAFALEAQNALGRLLSFGAPALLLAFARAGVTTLGLVAGRLLWRGEAEGWRLVRWWSLAAAAATTATFLTPYFPSNRAPGEKWLALAAWLVVYALWFVVATRKASVRRMSV